MKVEDIAKVCHEINRAFCQSIGDDSQKKWEDAPQWQKDSAIVGVKMHLDNPDAGPEASHESWMKHKLADGWVYGETKDEVKKTHHCLVPYNQLPVKQQSKDYIFRAIVHSLKDYMYD